MKKSKSKSKSKHKSISNKKSYLKKTIIKNKIKLEGKQDIFDNEKYLEFVKNDPKLYKCYKKGLINYNKSKFEFSVETNSNLQIKTFFKNAYKNNALHEILRMQFLFIKFINIENAGKLLFKFKFNNFITDREVVKFIKSNLNDKNKLNDYQNQFNLCSGWFNAFQSTLFKYENDININISKKQKKIENNKLKYIDIGCGDGSKTKIIAELLKLDNNNVFCTDIDTWGLYKEPKETLPYQFKYIIDDKLNYDDNQFDLVSCTLTLHHIKNLNFFIKEIYRILKPGGHLLIVEHAVNNDYDRLFINIDHMLMSALVYKNPIFIENPDYIYCYNLLEWNYIFHLNNLTKIETNTFNKINEFSFNYYNLFYGFYKKN